MNAKSVALALAGVLFALAVWWALNPSPFWQLYHRYAKLKTASDGAIEAPMVAAPSLSPTPARQPMPPGAVIASPVPALSTPSLLTFSPTPMPEESATDPASPATQAAVRNARLDADKVKLMLRDFHNILGENPVGTNAEIMRSLLGGNAKQATLGPPEGMTLNGNGELLDQWQTPYFFHQISKDIMEIRSAGPDKKLYTADDLVSR